MIPHLTIIKYALPVVVTAFVAGYIHNWRVDSLRLSWQNELEYAVQVEKEKCTKEKVYAKESAHALQSRLNDLSDTYIRMLKTRSQLSAASYTGGTNGSTDTNGPIALTDEQRYLNDIQAAKLIAAQGLIRHIYEVNHQADFLPAE